MTIIHGPGGSSDWVADVGYCDDHDGESGAGNARLIAAAPELLAEIELLSQIAGIESPRTQLGGWDWKGIHERLTALLAKAKGGAA
jgi:hypothetical protein